MLELYTEFLTGILITGEICHNAAKAESVINIADIRQLNLARLQL